MALGEDGRVANLEELRMTLGVRSPGPDCLRA